MICELDLDHGARCRVARPRISTLVGSFESYRSRHHTSCVLRPDSPIAPGSSKNLLHVNMEPFIKARILQPGKYFTFFQVTNNLDSLTKLTKFSSKTTIPIATMLGLRSATPQLHPDTEFPIPTAIDPILPPVSCHVPRSEKDLLLKTLRERKPSQKPMSHPTEHEFKPQAKRRKSCRGPGSQVPREDISPERARHLERNRVAANRCRLKKKKEHEQIQVVLENETARRDILLAEVDFLKEELWRLKNRVFEHANCDDHHISLQLSKMNQDLLDSSSQRRSSSSSGVSSSGGSEEGAMCMDLGTSFPGWGDYMQTMPVYDQASCGGYFDEILDNFVDVNKM